VSEQDGASREELLALIAGLRAADRVKDARIDALLVQVGELTVQVQALVLRPGKNSSKRLVDDPDQRIATPTPAACRCGCSLAEQPVTGVRRRQVHDLPEIPAPVVTEYRAGIKSCPECQAETVGGFPAGVNAPAQYGPEIATRVADVVVGHHVPVRRSTVLVMELLGMQVPTGFAAGLRGRAAALIRDGGFLDAVKKLPATAPVGAPRTCTWPAPSV